MKVQVAVEDLLVASFDDGQQLRRYLGRRFGRRLAAELPGESVPDAELFSEAVGVLQRRGLVDSGLLGELRAHGVADGRKLGPLVQQAAAAVGVAEVPVLRPRLLGLRPKVPVAISVALLATLGMLVASVRLDWLRAGWAAPLALWSLAGAAAWVAAYAVPEQGRRIGQATEQLGRWLSRASVADVVGLADAVLSRVYGRVVLGRTALRRVAALASLPVLAAVLVPGRLGLGGHPAATTIGALWLLNVLADLLSHAHTHQLLRELRPRATGPRLVGVLAIDTLLTLYLSVLPVLLALAPSMVHAARPTTPAVPGFEWVGPLQAASMLVVNAILLPFSFFTSSMDQVRPLATLVAVTAGLPSLLLWTVVLAALAAVPAEGAVLRLSGRLAETLAHDERGALGVAYPAFSALLLVAIALVA